MPYVVQAISLVGAVLILGAFLALQRGWWSPAQRRYLWANLVGAGLLTGVAVWDRRLGFIVLEATWAAIAGWSLLRRRAGP
ncbi:MAG: hypothetical protein OER21_10680 [Gemmatimonadota bacterium]|nr:hypothetical protein [Gemmatimonadota bacterium]